MSTKYRFIQSDVSVVLQGTLDPDPLADPAAVYVETVHAPPTTFVAPFMYDDTPGTGGLYGWDGTEYISVGSAAPPPSGLTLLATQILAVDGPIDFTGIDQNYADLVVSGMLRGTRAASVDTLELHINNDSATHYSYQQAIQASSAWTVFGGNGSTVIDLADQGLPAASQGASVYAALELTVTGYVSTIWQKMITAEISTPLGSNGTGTITVGTWTPTPAAVTRLTLYGGFTTNLAAGSVARLYGRGHL